MTRVDLLVLNGTLVTMDKDRRVIPEAGIAVAGGRIVAVGSSSDIVRMYQAPERVDAAGKIILSTDLPLQRSQATSGVTPT